MQEQILLRGIKSKGKYILLSLCVALFGVICLLTFLFEITTMLDFLVRIGSYLLLIVVIFIEFKILQSYKNDEIYLTSENIVLKRGNNTFKFPYENIIKMRALDTSIHGVISIRTKDFKKYIVNNIENAKEFYFKYIEVRNSKNLPPEHDKENPIAVVLLLLALVAVICIDIFQDNLESIPAPEFITQEDVE